MDTYSGCQKTVPVFKRFFLQPLMPQFRHLEHNYGKRYKKQGSNPQLMPNACVAPADESRQDAAPTSE